MGRTKWPASKFSDIPKIIKLFIDAYNTYEIFGERLLSKLRKQLFGSGWSSSAVFEVEQQAMKRSNWSKDEFVNEQIEFMGRKPAPTVKIVEGGLAKHHKGRLKQEKRPGMAYHKNRRCPICSLMKPASFFRTLPATGMKICPPCFKRINRGGR